jgi:hypothetical protein
MMLLHTLHIYGLEILARQIRQADCQAFGRRRMMSLSAVDPWGRKKLYWTDNGVKNPCYYLDLLMYRRRILCTRDMENISRGPTFGDFVTIRTKASMQDVTVARLQSKTVKNPLSYLF